MPSVIFQTVSRRCVLGSTLGGGHRTLGWAAAAPTAWAAEARLGTLKAIHPPPATSSAAPTSTVGGVLAGPIVASYTSPKGYINTVPAAQRAPAHLGSTPERQTATPRSKLPTNTSTTNSREVNANMVSAKVGATCETPLCPPGKPAPPRGRRRRRPPSQAGTGHCR